MCIRDSPYRKLVGMLLYLTVGSRPDIASAVNVLSRFVTCYDKSHWKALKRVVRYLQGTDRMGVTYDATKAGADGLVGYGDADWGSDVEDCRSICGYVFYYGGGPVSWKTRKQATVALSTTEAEYLSATEATKQALHHRVLLGEMGVLNERDPTLIWSDNQGCIALSENPVHHDRTKHFDIRHHFVREKVTSGDILLKYIPTGEMIADVLTKPLTRQPFEVFRSLMCT